MRVIAEAIKSLVHNLIQKLFKTINIEKSLTRLIEKHERKGKDIYIYAKIYRI